MREDVITFEVGVDSDELTPAETLQLTGLRIERGRVWGPPARVVSVDQANKTVTFTWGDQ
jgi:hypothetical protein